jgi:oligopeptide/dipeptide ABC transporter ATP-binding protein
VIEHISDEVAVMYLGKIVEQTSCEKLYHHPAHPYTQALISSIPRIDLIQKREQQVIFGEVPSPINPPSGCRFHTRCPFAAKICLETIPPLQNISSSPESHWVACHFSKEIKNKKTISAL